MCLLVFLSEYGEMDVALRMLTKVNEERVGASHSRVHVVIHGRIVHQLAECSLVAVKAVCSMKTGWICIGNTQTMTVKNAQMRHIPTVPLTLIRCL